MHFLETGGVEGHVAASNIRKLLNGPASEATFGASRLRRGFSDMLLSGLMEPLAESVVVLGFGFELLGREDDDRISEIDYHIRQLASVAASPLRIGEYEILEERASNELVENAPQPLYARSEGASDGIGRAVSPPAKAN